jgi:ribosomal protein S18 acetylase RimI-like enzyme
MRIRKIKPEDKEGILEFIDKYPYKELQRKAQNLDKGRLNEFHCRRILENASNRESLIGFNSKGNVTGIAILDPRPWHSEIFEKTMVKVSPFLLHSTSTSSRERFIKELFLRIEKKKYQHIELRVDVNEWENVALLEANGLRFVDCSIKLFTNLDRRDNVMEGVNKPLEIEECREEHLDRVKSISRAAHQFNHFFADTSLERSKAEELFTQWVEKCYYTLAHRFWLAMEGKRIMGFATILAGKAFNKFMGRNIAVLDFIAVAPEFQGKGVGKRLLLDVLDRLREEDFEQVELRTSINNYPALNLYVSNGFHIIGTDTILTMNF